MLIHAFRVDTGQAVIIPAAHMDIFPGVFTTTDPTAPKADTHPPTAPVGEKTPPVGETKKENH